MAGILVIGVGNAFRGDDGAGIYVARQLAQLALSGLIVLEIRGDGTELMEAWDRVDHVILVDAVSSGGTPGMIYRFDVANQELPAILAGRSTHAFGPAEAIELARQLDRLPAQMIVYGIEGYNFETGGGLSAEVRQAVGEVVKQIVKELDETFLTE